MPRAERTIVRGASWLGVALAGLLVAGCGGGPSHDHQATRPAGTAPDEEAEIQAARAKLSPEDRKLADAQDYCPIGKDSRLGSMGVPFKVMVKDQPVFLCCKNCQNKALADPDKTLAKVEELKAKRRAATAKK